MMCIPAQLVTRQKGGRKNINIKKKERFSTRTKMWANKTQRKQDKNNKLKLREFFQIQIQTQVFENGGQSLD